MVPNTQITTKSHVVQFLSLTFFYSIYTQVKSIAIFKNIYKIPIIQPPNT